jgi:hypothetical protein
MGGETEGDFTDNSNKWPKCNTLNFGNQLNKGRVHLVFFKDFRKLLSWPN